jgi:hypothetical protein
VVDATTVERPSLLARPPGDFFGIARRDLWPLAVLVVLPFVAFVVPAFLGHQVVYGDNFAQNYPLRAFVGSQIRHGHLPLYDPYIWSGAPLLGGWNAGAAYPLTFLFVIMPATAAWALNLMATFSVAGITSYCFLRASRLSPVPSLLGGLTFSFAGAMTPQLVHFGLVAGTSWIPLVLLALLRLSEPPEQRAGGAPTLRVLRLFRLQWCMVLAVAEAMNILAGEPRAITTSAVVTGVYAVWRAVRLGPKASRFLLYAIGGLMLAIGLGAVQLLTGTEVVHTSQRSLNSVYLFTSGSLPLKWILLLLVPDLLGGSGSFGQPPFLASYNLTEVSGYVGILPLVAAFALLGRLHWRRPVPEWLVWHLLALIGILLALGNSTPLWHLLIHIPFFSSQRLQSRNIAVADLAFAFLLAYWADTWLTERAGGRHTSAPHVTSSERHRMRTAFAAVPALATVAVVVVGFSWGAGFLQWMGVTLRAATEDGGLRVWFIPFGVLGAGAIALLLLGPRATQRIRKTLLVSFVVVDIVVYVLMTVAAVDTGLGRSAPTPTSASAGATTTTTTTLAPGTHPGNQPSPGASVPGPPTTLPASAFTGGGRFAVYDPDLLDGAGLNEIGAPDLNVVDAVPSSQGYGSVVDGNYASATGTHQPTGLGQDIVDPAALANGTFDHLDTTVLFSPRDYFLVDAGADTASASPMPGLRRLGAHGSSTWYLGENLLVKRISIPDATARSDIAGGIKVLLEAIGGSSRALRGTTPRDGRLEVSFKRPVAAVALTVESEARGTVLGTPEITSADGTVFDADGQLSNAVVPPHWRLRAIDGSFAVFENTRAVPPLTLRALPGAGSTAGAIVHRLSGTSFSPASAFVSSPSGVQVVRAVAAIPGWHATWRPSSGRSRPVPIARVGLVQAVDVPAGTGVVSWTYDPPGWTPGWILSSVSLVVLISLCASAAILRRRTNVPAPRSRRRL